MSASQDRLGVFILQVATPVSPPSWRSQPIPLSHYHHGPRGNIFHPTGVGGAGSKGVPPLPARISVSAQGSFSRGGVKGLDPINK